MKAAATARIEDHALIGDLHSAALVSIDGTLNWLCWPQFDSPAAFSALLGTEQHGAWALAPIDPVASKRAYQRDSLILHTEWETAEGRARVVDFMPPFKHRAVVRIVEGTSGIVRMRMRLAARLHYGKQVPLVRWLGTTGALVMAGPDAMILDAPVPLDMAWNDTTPVITTDFPIHVGQRLAFVLRYQPSHEHAGPGTGFDIDRALASTERYWTRWTSRCTYTSPDDDERNAVMRSLITLKALTFTPTGAIVAAPTTSLPEDIGGVRNWDYRFGWLRDAAMTLTALVRTGYLHEAEAWRAWLLRAVAGDPDNLQIMYGIRGERRLTEYEADWLPGHEGSTPVRIGNAAAEQFQLDVYGEVIDALYHARLAGMLPCPETRSLELHLVRQVEQRWREPDEGIWEVRGPRRHFVHSKVMAWVAVDRTITMLEADPLSGTAADQDTLARLRVLRDEIHRDVCEHGYDPERNTFTQSYGSPDLDAALLLLPILGFLPPDDKRVIGTIEAIQHHLGRGALVTRYSNTPDPETGEVADGLPGNEGAFLLCSFWLVEALTAIGRTDEAHALFNRLLALRNDVGLLAEEWDTRLQRQVGNFPQAFSHLGLITAALSLRTRTEATAPRLPTGAHQ